MGRYFLLALLIVASGAHALQSIRVGSQILVVGDSAMRVKQLLGEPPVRAKGRAGKPKKRKRDSRFSRQGEEGKAGERWQYRHGRYTTTFFIVDGKIAHIEDTAR